MKINESQTPHILVVDEYTEKSQKLVELLRRHFSVRHVQTKDDAERGLKQNVSLVIAQQHVLTQLDIPIPENAPMTPHALWLLLVSPSDHGSYEHWAAQQNIYHCVQTPWHPEELCHLAIRAVEHYQLAIEHHISQTELHQLKSSIRQSAANERQHPLQADRSPAPAPSPSEKIYQELHHALSEIVQSEKMVMLGQMVAGIAHEINTPSGAINAASVNMIHHLKLLVESLNDLERQKITREHLREILAIVGTMLDTLGVKQRRSPGEVRTEQKRLATMLQQQDVSDWRRLSRDIARMELTEHTDTILRLARLYGGDRILLFFTHCHRIVNSTKDIKLSIDMLTRIIQALKSYSYPWREQLELADVHETIETALILLGNKLKHQIHIDAHFADVPKMLCYPGELSHVWINIIHNAIQAIQGKGEILIETFATEEYLGVKVTDSGVGIPPDVQPQIFSINFTTKSREEGTGLGLYIVQQIIEKHKGSIEVTSIPGQTTFEVHLPFQQIL